MIPIIQGQTGQLLRSEAEPWAPKPITKNEDNIKNIITKEEIEENEKYAEEDWIPVHAPGKKAIITNHEKEESSSNRYDGLASDDEEEETVDWEEDEHMKEENKLFWENQCRNKKYEEVESDSEECIKEKEEKEELIIDKRLCSNVCNICFVNLIREERKNGKKKKPKTQKNGKIIFLKSKKKKN